MHLDHDLDEVPHRHASAPPAPSAPTAPASPSHRRGRAGRLGQDRPGRDPLPGTARRAHPRGHHQRHLHPRGRRVPLPRRSCRSSGSSASQTGGCPHTAIRDDASANLEAVANFERQFPGLELVLVESGGDNLTAVFSRELADVSSSSSTWPRGDKIPRKGGPGICNSDLLVINKTDLAPHVGADLEGMARDAKVQRGQLPVAFTSLKSEGGVKPVADFARNAWPTWPRAPHDPHHRRAVPAARRAAPRRRAGHRPHLGGRRRRRRHPARPRRRRALRTPAPALPPDRSTRMRRRRHDAPLGGDRLRIEAAAEQGAAFHITSAAATLALRGPASEPATYDVELTVGEQAELRWLPKPLISAAGSNLRQTWSINLAPTARLVLREEQILGRTGEPPGRVTTRLTVRRGVRLCSTRKRIRSGRTRLDGPAVLADHRAAGQILIVDPAYEDRAPDVRLLGNATEDGQAVLTPLAGPAALVCCTDR